MNARGAPLVALVVLAVLPYLPALPGEAVYDDLSLLNAVPTAGEAVSRSFWRGRGSLYRPVTSLTFAANGAASSRPSTFRLVNCVFHAAAVLVAHALARRVLPRGPAWVAAAAFAVHPIHVESVAQIVGRAELLAFAFGGGAWLLATGPGRPRPVAAAALALLALFSKEGALGLALAAGFHGALAPPPGLSRARGAGRALLPWLVALVPAVVARFLVLGHELTPALAQRPAWFMNPLFGEPFPVRLSNAPVLVLFYLGKLAWPVALSWDYGARTIDLAAGLDGRALGATAALAAVAAGAVLLDRARGGVAARVALATVVLGLAPVLHVAQPIGAIAADRFAFAPSLGFALVAGIAYALVAARQGPRVARAAAAVALGALAFATGRLAPDWTDLDRFVARGVRATPLSAQAQVNAGAQALAHGRVAEAEQLLGRAAALAPDDAILQDRHGRALLMAGKPRDAVRAFDRALELPWGAADKAAALAQRSAARAALGEMKEARRDLERSVALAETWATCANLAGLLEVEDPARAAALARRSLELAPEQPQAGELRALIARTGR